MKRLHCAIVEAHRRADFAALTTLYQQAANLNSADIDACAYYLTQALVYALESAHCDEPFIRQRLARYSKI